MTDVIGGGSGGGADGAERTGDPPAGVDLPGGEGPNPADDEEVEPVEVLVQLAEEGEIDPWDIDIVSVTDKFLARLDEADLRASGRALFYASVLLRMKSDALVGEEPADDPREELPPEEWGPDGPPDDGDVPPGFDPIDALEDEMDRRLDRKRARGTPETLDELVRELREHERGSWWKESREYDTDGTTSRGPQVLDYRDPGLDPGMDDSGSPSALVSDVAHEEEMRETKADVRRVLNEHYDHDRSEVLFIEIADAGGSPAETFLGVLFLANDGHVRLEQDELFGDLWIRDPSAGPAMSEAVAD